MTRRGAEFADCSLSLISFQRSEEHGKLIIKTEFKDKSLYEIRAAYKVYLIKQGLSKLSIQTAASDSFNIWNKRGQEIFWEIVYSDDFDTQGRKILRETLREFTRSKSEINIGSYMSHLRRFRRFLESESSFDIPTSPLKAEVRNKNKPRKLKQNLPDPCDEQVAHYLEKWETLEDYYLQENALDRLFFKLCPENHDISDVLLKVSALNDFYSTHIFKVFPMAKHIVSLDIDERLRVGDVTLVRDIQKVSGGNRNHYSFATKYCSHHKPLDYPFMIVM